MPAAMENAIWKKQVRAAAAQDTLGHALILCGDGDLPGAAAYISAAYLCAEDSRPCMRCNSCRKVSQQIHPDITVVRDPEHRYISVDVIRNIRREAYIRPNEGGRRIFIFPDCTLLTEQDQNVLLKILEEGPAYAAFLFCTQTSHSLLPTIRSRCMELHITEETVDPAEDPVAQELCLCIAQRKILPVAQMIAAWEGKKPKREQLMQTFQNAREAAAQALLARYGKRSQLSKAAAGLYRELDSKALEKLVAIFEKAGRNCEYNVGVGLTLGAMLSDIEEVI